MPTIRQLEYLVAVDDERHFGRAAEKVHVAQPTLSSQLSTLEQRLKIRLFERSRSGVTPTPVGQEIIVRARKILAEREALVEFAREAVSPLSGRLRLGVPPTLGPYLLPYIVPHLHQQFPQLKLLIREGAPREIQDQLMAGDLDLALSPLPVLFSKVQVETVFTETLHVVHAADHPLAEFEELTGADLKDQKVLTMEARHHLHNQVKELCDHYGAELLYDYQGTSLDALRHMVQMGAGISFFPSLYVLSEVQGRTDRSGLVVRDLAEVVPTRTIALLWHEDHRLTPYFQELTEQFRKAASGILEQSTTRLVKA